ncbi:MAG: dehydrogenase [Aquificaceae bacterium]
MNLEPTKLPLTAKDFDTQKVGFCAGCGCGCGYILYIKDGKIVDLYGHPSDKRGVGSFCTKGLTYIQGISKNPIRLNGAFFKRGEEFNYIDLSHALELLKERLLKGKTAFLLGRQAGIEEYLLAKAITEDVFVDAPVVDFIASSIHPTQWKGSRFILSVDAEPVFSEVMATRWLVDAVESGAYLFCLSSRYETLCSKAKERRLLKPDLIMDFLSSLLDPEKKEDRIEFVKRSLFLLRGSLVLVGAHLLNSPFERKVIELISGLRNKYGVNYSFVGDVMPFPARRLEEFFERMEEFENLVVLGNLFRYFKEEHLKALEKKFVVSFQVFPNITAHYSHILFASTMFYERDFINYRHGFGYLVYSPKVLEPEEGVYNPYKVLSSVFSNKVDVDAFLQEFGVDLQRLKEEGEAPLKGKDIALIKDSCGEIQRSHLFLYTDSTLVEELGHWNPWTHDMERAQKAYINPHTAKRLGLRHSVEIRGVSFELHITENVAEGVIFIPSEYEEFQPFDPGYRVGAFTQRPYHRYEVLI